MHLHLHRLALVALVATGAAAVAEEGSPAAPRRTDVCEILKDPPAWRGKLVELRGKLREGRRDRKESMTFTCGERAESRILVSLSSGAPRRSDLPFDLQAKVAGTIEIADGSGALAAGQPYLDLQSVERVAPKIDLAKPPGAPGAGPVDAAALEDAVRYTMSADVSVAAVDVEGPSVFQPSAGPEGTACRLGPGSEILWRGKQGPSGAGDRAMLYPKTTEKKVIILLHEDGNWLPHSGALQSEIEEIIRRAADRGAAPR